MNIIVMTIKGLVRDRMLHGIMICGLVFLLIPSISTLSMRQVTELALTLGLSLVSFILLLLAVFLGGVVLWKDVERRYTHSVLTLPYGRGHYLLGRFLGIALFMFGTAVTLGALCLLSAWVVSGTYPPDRPVSWPAVLLAVGLDYIGSILLVAFAMLFSSLSTSFFLPIFGTITIYLVGSASQQAYDYVLSQAGQSLPSFSRYLAEGLYFIVPNFSAFNLKSNAIYGIAFQTSSVALTTLYGLVYTAFVLTLAMAIFSRREMG
jgi:ABC-type transport system involved in multi-copper enzyme maturation permease subunit